MIFAKKDYSLKNIIVTLCVLVIALLVNCFGSVLATKITFPLYLDSVMTFAVTALCGLIPGILCAVLSNGILFLFDYTMLPFMSCHIITAFLAWLVFVHADKKNARLPVFERSQSYEIDAFLWAGVWSALSNAILGNIIADLLFGARVNRQNAECTVQGIYVVTRNLLYSTYLAGFIENITDKLLSAVLSYGMYEGVRRVYKRISA